MKNKSDSFLIKEYQNGCEDAFVVLINRYKSELFTFIYYKVLDEKIQRGGKIYRLGKENST